MYENLDNKLAVMYAASAYDNPSCMTLEEFLEDFKRFKYVKRLCRRYVTASKKGQSTFGSERLLLNHVMLLANVFGVSATVRILFLKCDEKLWPTLKTVLAFHRYLPETVKGINGKTIWTDRVPLDEKLLQRLREL